MNNTKVYQKKTPTSAKIFTESKKLHINGVSHNIRYFKPYPFVTKSASNSTLIDVDQNTYTDYWMGHWSLILGHKSEHVTKALHDQIESGWMYGTVNEQTMKLSQMIKNAVPIAEKTRYTTSGTEATMYATRIARAHTKRDIIAKIDGGWHGYGTDLLKSVNWPFDIGESNGMIGDEKIISIPYNDLDESIKILARYKERLAGIIIEPLLGGAGCIPASKEYLKGMQEFIHHNDSLFILDEIVTGFRFKYGCMYDTMSLEPDIITLGKIIGGGMPIGAICGTDEIMSDVNTVMVDVNDNNNNNKEKTETKNKDHTYIGGGTFSANPISMTAGSATLNYLKNNKTTYDKINAMGSKARKGLCDIFGNTAIITGIGSTFMTHFLPTIENKKYTHISNAKQAAMCNQEELYKYHFKLIAQDGIFILPGKMSAISSAHTNSDIEQLILASEDYVRST